MINKYTFECLEKFISYTMTCRKNNTEEWMEEMARQLTTVNTFLNNRRGSQKEEMIIYIGDSFRVKTL